MAWKAIVGLGNPGPRYAATRHNVGFLVIDHLATRLGISLTRGDASAVWGAGRTADHPVLLVKPMLYMNRSGEAVAPLLAERGVSVEDLLVAHDELDLPCGRLKLKRGGGTAGHRGLESLVAELGSADFCRLRVGIGRPAAGADAVTWVLSPFAAAEREPLAEAIGEAAAAAVAWLEVGLEAAMNRVNARPRPAPPQGGPADGGGAS